MRKKYQSVEMMEKFTGIAVRLLVSPEVIYLCFEILDHQLHHNHRISTIFRHSRMERVNKKCTDMSYKDFSTHHC